AVRPGGCGSPLPWWGRGRRPLPVRRPVRPSAGRARRCGPRSQVASLLERGGGTAAQVDGGGGCGEFGLALGEPAEDLGDDLAVVLREATGVRRLAASLAAPLPQRLPERVRLLLGLFALFELVRQQAQVAAQLRG